VFTLQALLPKALGEQRDRLSQQGGTGGALVPAAMRVNLPPCSAARAAADSDRRQTQDQPAQSSRPRQSVSCSSASHWNLRGTVVAFKGQSQKYSVACSLLDHISLIHVFSLLQAVMALELHLLQHMARGTTAMAYSPTSLLETKHAEPAVIHPIY